jgi:hypothetical protein
MNVIMFEKMRNTVCILLLILTACQPASNFSIEGLLPDKTYDGEIIYLVPIKTPVKAKVDSMIVKDGSIQFHGHVGSPEICVIRAKPVLRYNLEELLVVREPGNLTVKIGKSSSVQGTPLNDSLQHWKERKMRFDFVDVELVKQFRAADEASKPGIQQRADSLHVDAINFHFNFVQNNKDNVVGQFVRKMMDASFTVKQKKKLDLK